MPRDKPKAAGGRKPPRRTDDVNEGKGKTVDDAMKAAGGRIPPRKNPSRRNSTSKNPNGK